MSKCIGRDVILEGPACDPVLAKEIIAPLLVEMVEACESAGKVPSKIIFAWQSDGDGGYGLSRSEP